MTVERPIDVFDRGPRFRAHRYAVRLHSRDGSRVVVTADHGERSVAVFDATLLRQVLDTWGIAAHYPNDAPVPHPPVVVDTEAVTKRKPSRIVVEIVNRDGRIIAQSATGRGAVTWTMQSAAIVKAGNYVRARTLGETEHPMEVERT